MPEKEMRQHTRQHMVVPPWVFAHFIVVHAQFGFRLLKALELFPNKFIVRRKALFGQK
jgi:hypothetical protein